MRLLNRLLTASLVVAVVLVLLVLAGPITGAYRTTTVLSGSMRPTIDPGDVVVAVPIDVEDVVAGDIVTFQLPDGTGNVTHRVTAADNVDGVLHVTTKGDANDTADAYDVRFFGDTAWRTEAVIPRAGYAFVAARAFLEQRLYLPIIGMLAGISLLWTIWRPTKERLDAATA